MGKNRPRQHPCIECGACCATYRVSFERSEWESYTPQRRRLLQEWIKDLGGKYLGMKCGASKHRPCCQALNGKVGKSASCEVYELRPSPCRNFRASFDDGLTKQLRCDEARRAHGLRALTPFDWPSVEESSDKIDQETESLTASTSKLPLPFGLGPS